jgi:hypothetical protein
MRAYHACKERLKSVEETLAKHFGNEEAGDESPPPPNPNEEIPF